MFKFFSKKTDSSAHPADRNDPRDPSRADLADVKIKADDILIQRKEVFGKLYLVSLEDIFRILGGHSPRVDEAVRLICNRAIERHVGGEDIVEIEREDVYIFRFPEIDEAQGWAKAKAIVDEVGANVLGQRYVCSEEKPMIRLAVVDAATVKVENGDLDDAALKNALDTIRGKTRGEALREWQRFTVRKKGDAAGNWTEFRESKHQSNADMAWGKIKDACQKAFMKRGAADRRKFRLPFEDIDKRHSFDRRGRG